MIRASIVLTFKSGQKFEYANAKLVDKKGDDGEGNILHKGRDTFFYCYTGSGSDTFDKQTGKGKIKGDFEFFKGQIGGSGLLKFPENSDTTELVRHRDPVSKLSDRFSIAASELVGVAVKELWERFPDTDNRESGYMLPKDSRDFAGFSESKDIKERGPDFNKNWNTDNGFIPRPILEINGEGKVVVTNSADYDSTVVSEDPSYFYAYGVKNGKKSGLAVLKKERHDEKPEGPSEDGNKNE